jgi:deoxyadenosine/deoxycytidine kinase
MMAYISRLKLLKDTINQIKVEKNKLMKEDHQKYIIITERSLFTDKMVFAKMLYDSGKIEHVNYQIYLNWFNTFSEEFPIHKVIYVKTDPKICHQRIATRHRDGEGNIPIDYLKSCSEYHDNMLDKSSSECVCKEQIILDGNNDIYEDEDILNEWIDSIEKFINE